MSTVRHAAVRRPQARRGPQARRSSARFTAFTAILAVVVTVLLVLAVFPLRSYLSERSQIDDLNRRITSLQQENGRLEGQIRKWHDPEFLQRVARECLGMVKPGEVSFAVVSKAGDPKPAPC